MNKKDGWTNMTELNNNLNGKIENSLNDLSVKWAYIISLVRMNQFIIENQQKQMPQDVANWLYTNMCLIESLDISDDVDSIKAYIMQYMANDSFGERILTDDELPF